MKDLLPKQNNSSVLEFSKMCSFLEIEISTKLAIISFEILCLNHAEGLTTELNFQCFSTSRLKISYSNSPFWWWNNSLTSILDTKLHESDFFKFWNNFAGFLQLDGERARRRFVYFFNWETLREKAWKAISCGVEKMILEWVHKAVLYIIAVQFANFENFLS